MHDNIEDLDRMAKIQRLRSITNLRGELTQEKEYLENHLQEFDRKVLSGIQYRCPVSKDKLNVINSSTIYCTVCKEHINKYESSNEYVNTSKCFFQSQIDEDDFEIGF